MRSIACVVPGLLVCASAHAAELVVQVTDSRGRPAADVVVTVTREPREAPAPATAPARRTIDQRDETFVPYVEVFAPGDEVVFENSDTTQHHVYSFSPTKTFELVLRPGERSDPIVLDRPGIVAVGCNIHDRMITYLYVADAERGQRASPLGVTTVGDLPAGRWTVAVWHPQLKPGTPPPTQTVELASDAEVRRVTFAIPLLPDPRRAAPDRGVY
ncbi:MAG TPA: hypothetical protein VFO79_11565 [Xanthomonadales bacterium]|nr:hypothetical protein [Xanthomonadales bacterium]